MIRKPLMEELFASRVMQMGPSRTDPSRQVGVFNPTFAAGLFALRAAEMERFRWLEGEWNHENLVPATPVSPAYTDAGSGKYAFDEKGEWICMVAPDGAMTRQITFDPFSRQWIYVLMRGAFGMLRSAEGWQGETIVFTGTMTMLCAPREWRMTWTREGNDAFRFVNEERGAGGEWLYIDEWRFQRKS